MNRKGNSAPLNTGPLPSMKRLSGRHLQIGHDEGDADGQRADGADLEEGGEIVARREQDPHRQDRGDEAIADQHQRQGLALEGEQRRERRVLG